MCTRAARSLPLPQRRYSTMQHLSDEVRSAFDRARSLNETYRCYNAILEEPSQEPVQGSLHQMPVAVKDAFVTKDGTTTGSSNMLKYYKSPFNATIVDLLQGAGAVLVGKTNMDELSIGSANLNTIFGPVLNPWGEEIARHIAGGSSGGSAAAVALGTCRVAIGSDTGGSVRVPASYCGVIGFKPSYGVVSRFGMLKYASSLDTVGIIGRAVSDVQLVFDTLAHHDENDPMSVADDIRAQVVKAVLPNGHASLQGVRVGVPYELFGEYVSDDSIEAASRGLSVLKAKGAELVPVSFPYLEECIRVYNTVCPCEAVSNFAAFDGIRFGRRGSDAARDAANALDLSVDKNEIVSSRDNGFGDAVKERILAGTYYLSKNRDAFYAAQGARREIQKTVTSLFRHDQPLSGDKGDKENGVDILVYPTTLTPAPRASDVPHDERRHVVDLLNFPASIAGAPACSVPSYVNKDGMPLSVQVMGQWGHDNVVLEIAEIFDHHFSICRK